MKKLVFFSVIISFGIGNILNAQGGLLRKVTNSVSNEILAKPEKEILEPEPACASDQAVLMLDMAKLQLDYHEVAISVLNDGRILAHAKEKDEYYVVKDGVTAGPYKSGDSRIADFQPANIDDSNVEGFIAKHKPYISRSGERLIITFGGKKYGPYDKITDFVVTKSKDKFAAFVMENMLMTDDQGEKMEEAMNNAKSDQERMEIGMKYAQMMSEKMQEGGGIESTQVKLVSNIPNTSYDVIKSGGASLNGNIKFDDILLTTGERLIDLHGNTVLNLTSEAYGAKDLFVNSDNTRYVYYKFGKLTFSDNTSLTDLFNPHLVKPDGKVYLSYMYYSPKKNALMQHKIAF